MIRYDDYDMIDLIYKRKHQVTIKLYYYIKRRIEDDKHLKISRIRTATVGTNGLNTKTVELWASRVVAREERPRYFT